MLEIIEVRRPRQYFFFFFFRASKNIYAKFGRDTLIDIESFTRYTNTHILLLYI